MKARGRYILGIDFDQRAPRVLVIPMRGTSPLWNQAEAVKPDAFETLVDQARRKAREKLHGTSTE